MVTQLFPIISTADLQRSLGFYRDLLGGAVAYEFPGPDGEVVYASLDIGESTDGAPQGAPRVRRASRRA